MAFNKISDIDRMAFNKITKIVVIVQDTEVHDSQDSSVSIVTILQVRQSEFESWQGKDISLFSMSSRQALGGLPA